MQFIHMISLSHISVSVMKQRELDISNGESITSNIDDGDDYWDFCGYLIKNPIYAISSKGSVYLEICGSQIYYTSIERSMDLETLENLSMEE